MPELLHPGIYTIEKPSGSMPIEGVGTNTTAFIGYAKSGPFGEPTLITSWNEFCRKFGEDENKILGLLEKMGKTPTNSMEEKVSENKETWIDYLRWAYGIWKKGEVEKEGKRPLTPDAMELEWRKYVKANNLQDTSPYIEFTSEDAPDWHIPDNYIANSYLAHAVRGYFDNGGSRAYIVRVAHKRDFDAHKGKDAKTLALLPKPTVATTELTGNVKVKALTPGFAGNEYRVEIESIETEAPKVSDPSNTDGGDGKSKSGPTKDAGPIKTVTVTVFKGDATLGTRTLTATELQSKTLDLKDLGISLEATASNLATLSTAKGFLDGGTEYIPESLGNVSKANDFEGSEVTISGRRGLTLYDDINIVCIPDLMAGVMIREVSGSGNVKKYNREQLNTRLLQDSEWKSLLNNGQQGLVDYCEASNDRIAILDPKPGSTVQDVKKDIYEGSNSNFGCANGQAALYYPWLKVADPLHPGYQILVPPSGHVAGVWVRVVTERGVHKAPANEALRGVVELERKITDGDQDLLNPVGINCIRNFSGQGIRIWGARTLASQSNPSYKYINVRRLINYLKKSLERGLQWAVFEPNDEDLWGRVSRNVSAFLFTEWKDGKLFGSVPDQAYFVKCNAGNNPREMIDQGRLNVEIGVSPVKPAEFIVLTIGQWDGGSSSSES